RGSREQAFIQRSDLRQVTTSNLTTAAQGENNRLGGVKGFGSFAHKRTRTLILQHCIKTHLLEKSSTTCAIYNKFYS
ncbi:MAG: hypothetical protein AAFP77_00005, partial [Bacteroidota bacterium]